MVMAKRRIAALKAEGAGGRVVDRLRPDLTCRKAEADVEAFDCPQLSAP